MRRRLYFRRVIGIIAGLVIAIFLIDGAWALAGRWFPSPVSPDSDDAATLSGFVVAMPLAGQVLVIAGWLVAGLAAAFIALRLSQWRPSGWIVAGLIVALDLWNATQLAQPWGMLAMNVIAPVAGAWLAERHFHRARPGDPLFN
jgi:hypothetical protein